MGKRTRSKSAEALFEITALLIVAILIVVACGYMFDSSVRFGVFR